MGVRQFTGNLSTEMEKKVKINFINHKPFVRGRQIYIVSPTYYLRALHPLLGLPSPTYCYTLKKTCSCIVLPDMVANLLNRRKVVTIPPTAAPQEGLTPASLLVVPKRRLKKKLGQL